MPCARIVSVVVFVLLIGGLVTTSVAQLSTGIPSYYDQNRFNLTSPVAHATPSGGYSNPAVYGWVGDFSTHFGWSNNEDRLDTADRWGLFTGFDHFGFGMIESETVLEDGRTATVRDMRVALVDHHWRTTIALAYGWSSRDDDLLGRSNILQVGMVHRYGRHLSIGAVGNFAVDGSTQNGLFDVALHTFDNAITLFADTELPKGISIRNAAWSAGALYEGIPGIELSGRYFSDRSYSVALSFKFYGLWMTGNPQYNEDAERTSTAYQIRF